MMAQVDSNTIGKYMRGRLGNQLFQYAAIRQIQEINGNKDKICLNFSKYVYSLGFNNDLANFSLRHYEEVDKIRTTFLQKTYIAYYKLIKRVYRAILPKKYKEFRYCLENKQSGLAQRLGIYWKEDGFLKMLPSTKKNKIVIGHFESSKNFDSIRPQLLEEIQPIHPPLEKNRKLYTIIRKCESVCISIRRGDFVSNPVFARNYNVCNKKYFEKAVTEMKKRIKKPVFIVFSDDIEWCKKNIDFLGDETYYEDGNDPVWEKLRLMYSCKHFIISNSTFSWWAQYLSRNVNKVVIAPMVWTNYGYDKDIYEKDWVLIKNR